MSAVHEGVEGSIGVGEESSAPAGAGEGFDRSNPRVALEDSLDPWLQACAPSGRRGGVA